MQTVRLLKAALAAVQGINKNRPAALDQRFLRVVLLAVFFAVTFFLAAGFFFGATFFLTVFFVATFFLAAGFFFGATFFLTVFFEDTFL